MACCGTTCDLSGTFGSVEGHRFTVNIASNEIDVRTFGSGEYGDWISCAKNGTVTIDSYIRPSVEPGDDVYFTANVCSEAVNVACEVTSQDWTVDSKDVVQFTTTLRMKGDISIT